MPNKRLFLQSRCKRKAKPQVWKYPLPYVFFFYTLFYLAVYPCGNNDLSRIHVACFYNKIVVLLIRFFFVFRLYYYVGFNLVILRIVALIFPVVAFFAFFVCAFLRFNVFPQAVVKNYNPCLLYTSDAADE